MVLIEDIDVKKSNNNNKNNSDDQDAHHATTKEITGLAVYNLRVSPQKFLTDGRNIAIMEPLYKERADGTPGIRVDNPSDIVLDVVPPSLSSWRPTGKSGDSVGCVTAEARLEQMLIYDSAVDVNSLYRALQDEGYSIGKRQIRALHMSLKEKQNDKAASLAQTGASTIYNISEATLIPILSERRPEKHRILRSIKAKQARQVGNEEFQSRNFEQAEKDYTNALACLDEEEGEESCQENDDGVNDVALWQLYGNRSAARMRLGKLEEATQDSLASNMCAPADVIKPLLRCAETLTAMRLRKETMDLLDATAVEFPHEKAAIETKKRLQLRVGPDKEFQTIARAVAIAPSGTEILVDPGVYCESLRLTKPVTLRGSSIPDDYAAIRSLEKGGIDGKSCTVWPEIRVNDDFAVHVHERPDNPIHMIGFRIVST